MHTLNQNSKKQTLCGRFFGTPKGILGVILSVLLLLPMTGCQEEVDKSARYVFTTSTVWDYLQRHEEYSEYCTLLQAIPVSRLSTSTVSQLMSARGNYTVFAPTNEAIQFYLDTLWRKGILLEPTWDGFPNETVRDSIEKVIVYNSIIDSGDEASYGTYDFPVVQDADIPRPNMYDRRLTVHLNTELQQYSINEAPIDTRNYDILLLNGIIHQMTRVVAPGNNTLGQWIDDIISENRRGFAVMAKMLKATGLVDSLRLYMDYAYEDKYQRGEIPVKIESVGNSDERVFHTPEHRYYGYTLFAEPDSLWEGWIGKPADEISLEDVLSYVRGLNVYPDAVDDDNYTKENNLLYHFVTYHLLPERLAPDRLVMHRNEKGYVKNQTLGVAMSEFFTTMGKRRLIKIYESKESNGIFLNRFPNLNNGRSGDYHELSCDPDKVGIFIGAPNMEGENSLRNAIVYPIDKLLVYDEDTRSNLQKGRIRWNVAAMMPEFINNDIRMCPLLDEAHTNVWIPSDIVYPYLSEVDISEDTQFFYWTAMTKTWENYQGDEFTIRGFSDVTFTLPPVPKRGTYELRYQVQSGGGTRGIVQFYWGSDKDHLAVMGIPLDLRLVCNKIMYNGSGGDKEYDYGWEADTGDEDYDSEVDKHLRNNGFMKGPLLYDNRKSTISTRRILFRQTMDPDETYYIRFKSVMDDPTRYLYMDFLEYASKEVYDNPETPEDIW